jgi:hypothetical protein
VNELQAQTDQLLRALDKLQTGSDVICYALAVIILLLVAHLIIAMSK